MKKIDLHIHTIANKYLEAHSYLYDSGKMKKYVSDNHFDIIAITNHNLFDLANFEKIKKDLENLNVSIFPGIEISLENGHILVIGDDTKATYKIFQDVTTKIQEVETNDHYRMTIDDFNSYFANKNFILIPHYDKNPSLSKQYIDAISEKIRIGEVCSQKSFFRLKKKSNDLIPVFFSDIRIGREELDYYQNNNRYTYLNCDCSDYQTIKRSLENINSVDLNREGLEEEFEILNGAARASSGINVLIGNRSSGKTYSLDRIFEENKDSSLYIKQFEITKDCKEEDFLEKLKNSEQQLVLDYFKNFLDLLNYIDLFNTIEIKSSIGGYISSLKQFANQCVVDAYSKLSLFNYVPLEGKNINEAKKIFEATDKLLSASGEYLTMIEKHIKKENLINLYKEILLHYKILLKHNKCVAISNDIIKNVSDTLGVKSAAVRINNAQLKEYFKIAYIRKKFNNIVKSINEREIHNSMMMNKFTKKIKVFRNVNKKKTKSSLGINQKTNIDYLFSESPYDAYLLAKSDDNIPNKTGDNRYKLFFDYEVHIIGKTNKDISGGQKAEYTLLNKLNNYQKYDFVLIDEMEASFDNPFLNHEINKLLNIIAKKCTVFISTHNNNLGVSLKPDFYIYHQVKTENGDYVYERYFGKSTEESLIDKNGNKVKLAEMLMNTMEANKKAYLERGQKYENFNN